MEEKIIKKRGRRSKTDIVAKNVEIDYEKYEQHKIIHVKNKNIELEDDPNPNFMSDNLVDKYCEVEYTNKVDSCWNCCEKIDNVVDSLSKFNSTKRAVVMMNNRWWNHDDTDEAKCLRELHFRLENEGERP